MCDTNTYMDALPANRFWQPSCSHGTYQHETIISCSRQLLMMGKWLPETCWTNGRRETKNTKVTSSWFFLSTLNYDARSTTYQMINFIKTWYGVPIMKQTLTVFIFLWRCGPTRVMPSSYVRFLDHTQRRTTVDKTPLDEWSARRRDLYLTTYNTHKASSFSRFLDHTQRRTTVDRIPLDEWSARRRDLYLTTHNTHKASSFTRFLDHTQRRTTVGRTDRNSVA
jgi:hypothetical protein